MHEKCPIVWCPQKPKCAWTNGVEFCKASIERRLPLNGTHLLTTGSANEPPNRFAAQKMSTCYAHQPWPCHLGLPNAMHVIQYRWLRTLSKLFIRLYRLVSYMQCCAYERQQASRLTDNKQFKGMANRAIAEWPCRRGYA